MADLKIIVVREGLIRSIVSDTVTFGFLISLMFLNVWYWGGHWYVTFFIMFLWLFSVMGRSMKMRREFRTNAEAIKYLQEEEARG